MKPLDLAGDAHLASSAAGIDADAARLDGVGSQNLTSTSPGAAPIPGAAPAPTDWPAEARDLVDFGAGLFIPLYPRLGTVWTPERLAALTTRLAPVLQKYDLNAARLMGKWGPEIMLAATIAPAIMPTAKAIKEDLDELRAKAREAARAAPPPDKASSPPPAPDRPAAAPPDTTQLHNKA